MHICIIFSESGKMSKTRKEKLIEGIREKLDKLEKLLFETPDDMTHKEYLGLIKEIQELRKALEIVKNF